MEQPLEWVLSFPNYLPLPTRSLTSALWSSVHSLYMSNSVPNHAVSCRAGLARHLALDWSWRAAELRRNHTVDSLLPFKSNVFS